MSYSTSNYALKSFGWWLGFGHSKSFFLSNSPPIIVAGMKKGRETDDEITIFDSTGLAIQDIICARLVYDRAREREIPVFELL